MLLGLIGTKFHLLLYWCLRAYFEYAPIERRICDDAISGTAVIHPSKSIKWRELRGYSPPSEWEDTISVSLGSYRTTHTQCAITQGKLLFLFFWFFVLSLFHQLNEFDKTDGDKQGLHRVSRQAYDILVDLAIPGDIAKNMMLCQGVHCVV